METRSYLVAKIGFPSSFRVVRISLRFSLYSFRFVQSLDNSKWNFVGN